MSELVVSGAVPTEREGDTATLRPSRGDSAVVGWEKTGGRAAEAGCCGIGAGWGATRSAKGDTGVTAIGATGASRGGCWLTLVGGTAMGG